MTEHPNCPVCQNKFGGSASRNEATFDGKQIVCDLCGTFGASSTLLATGLRASGQDLTPIQRMSLVHLIRRHNDNGNKNFKLTADWLQANVDQLKLPSPAQQAANAIRFVGDFVSERGYDIKELPGYFFASIGAYNENAAKAIILEIADEKLVRVETRLASVPVFDRIAINADLTLKGWERYEQEKRGKFAGSDGFIAMKFGDPTLDPFVNNVLKPLVKNKLGIDVKDMRDVSQAGIIDNIMRERIRDAAFVLVDLTHDNFGAYWEAGYAEGLGKPVIYLCEQAKFAEKKTHFDTNHCTTVMWSKDGDHDEFSLQIISTIRRSLNLFE